MNDIKKFLQRMINDGGYIARGIYSDNIHVWSSNSHHSQTPINMQIFDKMRRNGYIKQDCTGRYYPTDAGKKYAAPWYKKIFNII